MATEAKQRRVGITKRDASPSASPPLPPAPALARNRGAASPRPYADEPSFVPTPRPRSRGEPQIKEPIQAPPAVADVHELALAAAAPKTGTKLRTARRLFTGLSLGYLGYTLFFVCRSSGGHQSNAVCDGATQVGDWLHPYSEPVVKQLDGTYRTYAEPYVKEYAEPVYQIGQKYYVEVAQPAFTAATDKAKDSYNQYAHPHVNKAVNAIYTDNVKGHVHRVQKTIDDKFSDVKIMSMNAKDHVQHRIKHLHSVHVQPVLDKVSPHARLAWHHSSTGANKAYGTSSGLYSKHIHPHVHRTYTVVQDTAGNVKESFMKHTREIWGGRAARRAAEETRRAEKKAQEAAKKAKADADERAESVKDTLFKKAEDAKEAIQETVSGAQKVVGEYTDSIKAAVLGKTDQVKKAAEDQASKVPSAEEIKASAAEKGQNAQKLAEQFVDTVSKKAHNAEEGMADEAEHLRKLAGEKAHEAGSISENIKRTVLEKAHEAREAVARQADNLRHVAQEQVERVQGAGAYIVDSVTGAAHNAKEAINNEAEYIAKLADEKKKNLERLVLKGEKEAKKTAEEAASKAQGAYDAAGQRAEDIKAKVVKTGKDTEKAAGEKVGAIKKAAQEQVESAQDTAKEHLDNIRMSADQIVMSGKEKANEAQGYVAQKAKDAGEQVEHAKDNVKHKAQDVKHDVKHKSQDVKDGAEHKAHDIKDKAQDVKDDVKNKAQDVTDDVKNRAQDVKDDVKNKAQDVKDDVKNKAQDVKDDAKNKAQDVKHKAQDVKDDVKQKAYDAQASLAGMLAGIESTFAKFYDYEETETKNLWSNLQSSIDEHVEGAKKSARDLEKANQEAYETFESYVKDWRNQGGDLEDRLSKLSKTSVDSIKKMGLKAEEERTAATSKAQALSHNVEVYLSGLGEFLSDRLAASKETVVSELNAIKGTSSKKDDKTLRDKLAELEKTARSKLESTGSDARAKAKGLMNQAEDIRADSDVKSREYIQRIRQLTLQAQEDAKNKIQSVKEGAQDRVHEATDKVHDLLQEQKGLPEGGPAGLITDEAEPQIRIAMEEPGSGHRHHRH